MRVLDKRDAMRCPSSALLDWVTYSWCLRATSAWLSGNHHHQLSPSITDALPRSLRRFHQRLKSAHSGSADPYVSNARPLHFPLRLDDADTVFDVTGPAWPQHPTDLRKPADDLLAHRQRRAG